MDVLILETEISLICTMSRPAWCATGIAVYSPPSTRAAPRRNRHAAQALCTVPRRASYYQTTQDWPANLQELLLPCL